MLLDLHLGPWQKNKSCSCGVERAAQFKHIATDDSSRVIDADFVVTIRTRNPEPLNSNFALASALGLPVILLAASRD